MIRHHYNPQEQLLLTKVSGEVVLEEIKYHYQVLRYLEDVPKRLNVLIDCRRVKFKVDIDELKTTAREVELALSVYEGIREAILVEQPEQTVMAMMFQEYSKGLENYCFNVFSTKEAAMEWLLSSEQKPCSPYP